MNPHDPINHPQHYNQNGIECIDVIRAALTPEEFAGYLKGNAVKYLFRHNHKGNPEQDLGKARWYLKRAGEEGQPAEPVATELDKAEKSGGCPVAPPKGFVAFRGPLAFKGSTVKECHGDICQLFEDHWRLGYAGSHSAWYALRKDSPIYKRNCKALGI